MEQIDTGAVRLAAGRLELPVRVIDHHSRQTGDRLALRIIPADVLRRGERQVEPGVWKETAPFGDPHGAPPGGQRRGKVCRVKPGEARSVLADDQQGYARSGRPIPGTGDVEVGDISDVPPLLTVVHSPSPSPDTARQSGSHEKDRVLLAEAVRSEFLVAWIANPHSIDDETILVLARLDIDDDLPESVLGVPHKGNSPP